MSPFHFVILFLFVASMDYFIDGEEMNGQINITNFNISNTDNALVSNNIKQFNSSYSILSWMGPSTIPSKNLEAYMSTVEIIISRGYHVEIHPVTTEDDYILMLHRIPYPKGKTSGPVTGRPVYLQHGFGDSSADWVLLPSDKSLAFTLADLGYDVWLGNFRGNIYSRGHATFDSFHDDTYWKFSFDEMGRYDLPAAINQVLTVTGREKLVYIGFSMGSTALFICLNYYPELNNKIESIVAMAPVTTLAHTKTMIRYLGPLHLRIIQSLIWLMGHPTQFLSQDGSLTRFVKKYCLKNARIAMLCYNSLFMMVGADYGNMTPDMIRVVDYHVPSGASIRTLFHFGQNAARDRNFKPQFNKYDYGWIGNWKRYGKLYPPAYDLSKVTVPVYIFHAANDYLATPKDVKWTASKLSNVKKVVLVNDTTFNHLDMAFHRYAVKLVYNQIVAILPPP